jgi:hypothetical protein
VPSLVDATSTTWLPVTYTQTFATGPLAPVMQATAHLNGKLGRPSPPMPPGGVAGNTSSAAGSLRVGIGGGTGGVCFGLVTWLVLLAVLL